MIDINNQIHLVQTDKWNKFKKEYGNRVEKFEDIYFLVKKIPLTNKFMGYAPKVNFNIQKIDLNKLAQYCKKNNIAFIRFDIPNILLDTNTGINWNNKLKNICKVSPRNTFTKQNILLDLTPDIEDILKKMHPKKRYNIKYAKKNGVEINILNTEESFETFYKLHKQTADRQKFLTHSKNYFYKIYKTLDKIYFVEAKVDTTVVTSWLIIIDNKTVYYVYGGSLADNKYNKLYPNDLVGFETIQFAKKQECSLFDMWGAEDNKGFTEFKLKYGGVKVDYLPSYDLVISKLEYKFFNAAYTFFWKLQDIKKSLKK